MCILTQKLDPYNGDESSSCAEEEAVEIPLPWGELNSLKMRTESLYKDLPVMDIAPVSSGVFRNLVLKGIFPTTRWLQDPTMHADVKELFGGTPFFALGEYRVADVDLRDAAGTYHNITIILNTGVQGLRTGSWGCAFSRQPPHNYFVRFESAGEFETRVKEAAIRSAKFDSKPAAPRFVEFDCFEFCDDYFDGSMSQWRCKTQLEQLMGLAAEFILSLDWKARLPECMVEVQDKSSRVERHQRALGKATPKSHRLVETPMRYPSN